MTEYVDIIDDKGIIIGQCTRHNAHTKGLLHPTVNILLFNSTGKILLQQRSRKKIILPLYWDISVAEHVLAGETHYKAALRGLKEELSIKSRVKLLRSNHIKIGTYDIGNKSLIEYELVKLYGAMYDGKLKADRYETEQIMFVDVDKLKSLVNQPKISFTPWGLDELLFLLNNHKQIFEKLLNK